MIIIAAMTLKGVIGKNNTIPWHISEDLKKFKEITSENTVLMGRKTYESIGKPLPNRNNIVISSTMQSVEGIDVCRSLQEGITKSKSYGKKIFIIGGAKIYKQTLPLADKMYISLVKKEYDGDTFFPEFSQNDWEIEKKEDYKDFEFIVYTRK